MSNKRWLVPVLIGVACTLSTWSLTPPLAHGADDPPVVLIDATVLPQPTDDVPADVLERKLNAVGDGGGVDVSGAGEGAQAAGSVVATKAATDPASKALPACVGIDVRSSIGQLFADSFESGGIDAWGQSEARFSANGVLDLLFDVYFDGTLVGDHVLHLVLTTPRGHHYQTLSAPIASQTSAVGGQRRLEGYPYPVDVEVLEPVSASVSSASLRLPVAGTSIVTHGLYGTWSVEAFVDQMGESCGEGAEFRLVP